MANLYVDDLSKITLDDLRAFCGLHLPESERPREGLRLDFKRDPALKPDDRVGDTATAFANTYGGLVLMGVDEKDGQATGIPGLPRKGETKTRIGNMVFSAVHPVPRFSVGVVEVSSNPPMDAVVLRIDEGTYPPYMWISERKNKISVRVEDQCVAADPAMLEALYAKRGSATRVWAPGRGGSPDMAGQEAFFGDFAEGLGRHHRIQIVPIRGRTDIRLDLKTQRVVEAGLSRTLLHDKWFNVAKRSSHSFDLRTVATAMDVHRLWRFSSAAGLGLTSTLGDPKQNEISLDDLAWDLIETLAASRSLLEEFGRLGEVAVQHFVRVHDVVIQPPQFVRGVHGLKLDPVSISWSAYSSLDYSELVEPSATVAQALLEHLHTQGHADVDFDETVASIRDMHAYWRTGSLHQARRRFNFMVRQP
ncbi:MAG: ATP-binding protein [Planctomycetota bacterium]|nr:ATP-binding protein [Planctomycetota bacterium]